MKRICRCMLSKTVFDYASLKNSILRNCLGIKASFDDANLSFADLSGSDMHRASFRRANLSHANFYNVDLTSAIFDGALLYGTSFKDAKGIEEVSVQYIFVGTEDKPIKLEGDNIQKWLLESRTLSIEAYSVIIQSLQKRSPRIGSEGKINVYSASASASSKSCTWSFQRGGLSSFSIRFISFVCFGQLGDRLFQLQIFSLQALQLGQLRRWMQRGDLFRR